MNKQKALEYITILKKINPEIGEKYEKKVNINLVKMTKEEILEKAKRDYPVGTVFKQVDNGINAVIDEKSFTNTSDSYWHNDKCLIIYYSDMDGNKVAGCGCYLFKDGHWAEIISKPEVKVQEEWVPKVGECIMYKEKDLLEVTLVNEDKIFNYWIRHIPNSFSGGGFGWKAYKDKIRKALPHEIPITSACIPYNGENISKSFEVSQYPLTPIESFETAIYDFGNIYIVPITKKPKKLQTITIESTTDLNLNLTKIKSKQIQKIKI